MAVDVFNDNHRGFQAFILLLCCGGLKALLSVLEVFKL